MEPFIGQIMMFGGNFAPRGWALCDGQLLPIVQNSALFSLLGTTYGGDGKTSFGLPDLRGRVPMHAGQGGGLANRKLGEKGGAEAVALNEKQMPEHGHGVTCTDGRGDKGSPKGTLLAGNNNAYKDAGTDSMAGSMIQPAGAGEGHPNLQPYQCVNFIIALQGIFPSRN